jgi:hypothetical protein
MLKAENHRKPTLTLPVVDEIWSRLSVLGIRRRYRSLDTRARLRIVQLLRLADSTTFPHEAATARRIAEKLAGGEVL